MRDPDVVLDEIAFSYVIYAWVRGDRYLYIGMSGSGISRVTNHNVINKKEPFLIGDKILIWKYPPDSDWYDVAADEWDLIQKHRPQYNKEGVTVMCGEKYARPGK